MNHINQPIRITPAVEQAFSWTSQSADYKQKNRSQVLLFGILRLAIIIGLIALVLTAGA